MANYNMRHSLTKSQMQERSARRRNRPGRQQQLRGTVAYVHTSPEEPGFIPFDRSPRQQDSLGFKRG